MAKPSKRTIRKWKKELKVKREAEQWLHEELLKYEKELKKSEEKK